MRRRTYLTAVGSGLGLLAGCSDSGDGTPTYTVTRTATETPTATATATPEQTTEPSSESTPEPTPNITDTGLLLDQGDYSALDSDIESVGQGGVLVVGIEHELPVSGSNARGLVETTVYDATGEEIDSYLLESNTIVQYTTADTARQSWTSFGTESWERGNYTAEVVVNSVNYGTTAGPANVDFEVVEPLGENEVAIEQATPDEPIVVGEEFRFEFYATNLSGRDSSLVVDEPVLDADGGDPSTIDFTINENIPAGEEVLVRSGTFTFNIAGEYTFRLDEQDAEYSFTVEED